MIEIPTSVHAEVPKGAPFIIDRIPFEFGKRIQFTAMSFGEDKVICVL